MSETVVTYEEQECRKLVLDFFKGDIDKVDVWFETPNPGLGHITPQLMIDIRREKKLLSFIQHQLAENEIPPHLRDGQED